MKKIVSFLLMMFKWMENPEQTDITVSCFEYTVRLLRGLSHREKMKKDEVMEAFLSCLEEENQVFQMVRECNATIIAYRMAREIGQAYLNEKNRHGNLQSPEEDEYEADRIAYKIVMKMLIDKEKSPSQLQPYTYLAPVMYLDFFDLYYYTERILHVNIFTNCEHNQLIKWKNRLFDVINENESLLNSDEGNRLYSRFCEVCLKYRNLLLLEGGR